MSAIFGILRFDGAAASAHDVERIGRVLAHRGPDGRRHILAGPMALGHCLMRVNREDKFEAQPLRDSEADIVLAADLRLDNREELAAACAVAPADLAAMPDSALLMRAYRKWGDDCAAHLLGDFAFAIWDGTAGKLLLGRDHMGQRYVHYHRGKDFFVFATDIGALWSCPDVPRVLSDARIGRLLIDDRSPAEGETLFDGIRGLSAATVMNVGADGAVVMRRYWQPSAGTEHEHRDEAYYVQAYRRVLGEAVACRVRRVLRKPGVMLSGGYDSAAIAGLAGPALAGSGGRLAAAASVMPADYSGSIRHARRWVDMCARDMPHLDVGYVTHENRTLLPDLEKAFLDSNIPAGPYYFINNELLASLAGAGAQLVMDGHGGDYTLHPRGQAALARFLATFQLRRFARELRAHVRLSRRSLFAALRHDVAAMVAPAFLTALWRRARRGPAPGWRGRPINPAFARLLIDQGIVDAAKLGSPAHRLDMRAAMLATIRQVMNRAAPGLAASAARHGLELTRPFHDKRVVELALAIPQDLYVKNGRTRYLACTALRDVYPREFQARSSANDDEIPDFQRLAKAMEPQLLADIARMERLESLSRTIDFARIRALLALRGPDDHNSGWEAETQLALRGFVIARFAEWFRRDNR